MNYNIPGYMIYLPVTFYITLVVGKTCYTNGEVYLMKIINDDRHTVKAINRLLLLGYYLVNLGYAAVTISYWHALHTYRDLLETLCSKLGTIILLLGILHINNILVTHLISLYLNKKHQLLRKQSL